jgi:hypothetical protein
MSRKYIKQINNDNFVFPNYKLAEYDVEIIHDLKENMVSGSTSNLSISASGSNIAISFNYTWLLNQAEPFINNEGDLNILSVHLISPDRSFFKPWICVGYVTDANQNLTTKTGTFTATVTPAMMGQGSFTYGTCYIEVRFLGHRCVFPIEGSGSTIPPSPTPTVTPSHTPTKTPTPTPTPTSGVPTSTPTSTPTPSSTPIIPVTYDFYTAEEYNCDDCTLNVESMTVAFVSGTVVVPGKFYRRLDDSPYSYRILDVTTESIAPILVTPQYNSCALACSYIPPEPTPTPTQTQTPTPSGVVSATLSWSFSITNSPSSPYMYIYVNGDVIESREYDSSGNWPVYPGDVIYVNLGASGCSGPASKANVWTTGIISDGSCADNTTTLSTYSYTVISGDIGNVLHLDCNANCDNGCV